MISNYKKLLRKHLKKMTVILVRRRIVTKRNQVLEIVLKVFFLKKCKRY